jgi:hypothetical protein
MPNWCENVLKVSGPLKEISRFKKKVRGRGPGAKKGEPVKPLSFHSIIPRPESDEGTDLVSWSCNHWGTKWDACDVSLVTANQTQLEYQFETAWSPPEEWVKTVGPKFPKLSFRLWYAEGGMSFGGVLTVENDDVALEEMSYVAAKIVEHGQYEADCECCEEPIQIYRERDMRICASCLAHRCENCGKTDDIHIEGKCPFDSTQFKHIEKQDDGRETAEG